MPRPILVLPLLLLLAACRTPEPVTWHWHEMVRGDDIGWALARGEDDRWVAAGLTHPDDRRDPAAHAVAFSGAGDELWRYTSEIGVLSKAKAIAALPQGGYVLAGYTVLEAHAGADLGERADALLIRLDSNGHELWTHTWGGEEQDVAMGVDALPDGGIVVTGTTKSGPRGNRQAFLLAMNDDGSERWARRYGGPGADRGLDVRALEDGRIAFCGRLATVAGADTIDVQSLSPQRRRELAEQLNGDAWLVVTDASGEVMWESTAGDSLDDAFNDLEPTEDGGFILAGFSAEDESNMYLQAYVVKVDDEGGVEWSQTWGEPRWRDELEAIRPLPGGGYLAAGRATFNVVDGQHLLLLFSREGGVLREQVWGHDQVFDQLYDLGLPSDQRTVVLVGSETFDREMEDEFVVMRRLIDPPAEPGEDGAGAN